MKEKKIIFLSAFLHSGIDWVHSLLDSHPQILITPALSFYRCWTKFNFDNLEDGRKVYEKFHSYITKNVGPDSTNEQKKFLDNYDELDNFFKKLSDLIKNNMISRREAFLHINEAYLYAKKINENSIKLIIAHEHIPFYKNLFKKDFPESSLILVLRDPRAALAGSWQRRIKLFGYLPDYTFNMTIDSWFYAANILKDNFYKQKNKLYILKNEELHKNLKSEMFNLAKWLNIEFNESLLNQSFPSGKTVFVDSAYLLGDKPNDQNLMRQQIPNDYFKLENVTSRWMKALTTQQTIMIEGILSICFEKYGYKKIYKDNFYNKFLSFLFFIIPQRELIKYWSKSYPNLEAFYRIQKRLNLQKKTFFEKIWVLLPNFTKFLCLVIYSMSSRVKILLQSKEAIPDYDKVKTYE